jgi:hypothetical protein
MRDIDTISEQLRVTYPGVTIEQLSVTHPGADDDGIWFFRRDGYTTEMQLESSTGSCPFLVESNQNNERLIAVSVQQAVQFLISGLGSSAPAA